MISLSDEQLLKLCTMIYHVDFAKEKKYRGKRISYIIGEVIRGVSEHPDDKELPAAMSKQEWLDLLYMIKEDSELMNLRIEDPISLDKPGTVREEGDDNSGLRAVCLVNDANEAVVIVRGTGFNEWEDNGWGAVLDITDSQKDVVDYINSLNRNDLLLAGHSKGGNSVQAATILAGDKVGAAVSFDGQGFSQKFIDNNQESIRKNAGKIRSIRAENDFISALLHSIALPENTTFIKTEEFFGTDFGNYHKPNILLDSDGNLRDKGREGKSAKFFRDLSIHYSDEYGDTKHNDVAAKLLSFLQKDPSYSLWDQTGSILALVGEVLPEYYSDSSINKYYLLNGFIDDMIPGDLAEVERLLTIAAIDAINEAGLINDIGSNTATFFDAVYNDVNNGNLFDKFLGPIVSYAGYIGDNISSLIEHGGKKISTVGFLFAPELEDVSHGGGGRTRRTDTSAGSRLPKLKPTPPMQSFTSFSDWISTNDIKDFSNYLKGLDEMNLNTRSSKNVTIDAGAFSKNNTVNLNPFDNTVIRHEAAVPKQNETPYFSENFVRRDEVVDIIAENLQKASRVKLPSPFSRVLG